MDNKQEDKKPFSKISPASIDLTQKSDATAQPVARAKPGRSVFILVSLGLVLLLAARVIFVLPDWSATQNIISVKPKTENSRNGDSITTTKSIIAKKPATSPWTEAQLVKQRKETQDILADMLKTQASLEEINVSRWAEEEYGKVLQIAESGDAAYRQREFDQARDKYQQALKGLKVLLENSNSVLSDSLTQGSKAIEANDAAIAIKSYQTALLIESDSEVALKGIQRAESLDEVLFFLRGADELIEANNLEKARSLYTKALGIDEETKLAKSQLKLVNQMIVERDFTTAMSRGYEALDNNEFKWAQTEFQQALNIKPNASEAVNAIRQAENKITISNINSLLSEAKEYEQTESWLQAVKAYNDALSLDANLAAAQQGKQFASRRAGLDDNLQQTIAKPVRLSGDTVYRQANKLHLEAQSVNDPGPRLKKQISFLSLLLKESRTPIKVNLQSNDLTEITLYKIGNLEHFYNKELSLIPGDYIVVGKRDGYRDVRVEFAVRAKQVTKIVIVQCEEKIAFLK